MRTILKYFIFLMVVSCSGALRAEEFVLTPPTACQAVFLNNALSAELKWNDNGIENFRSAKDAWVVCPIELTVSTVSSRPLVEVIVLAGNSSDSPVEFFCFMKEIGPDFGVRQSKSVTEVLQPANILGLQMDFNIDEEAFGSVSLTCRIPSGGALGTIAVFRS